MKHLAWPTIGETRVILKALWVVTEDWLT